MILTSLPIFCESFEVAAADYYPMGCSINEYEVSYIEDNGTLTKVSCHGSLADAKKVMKQNENYVVRQGNSYSPTKIVAMNHGLVYSYPYRSGTNTMYLYQNINAIGNSTYKDTYISRGYEMTYVDTPTCNSEGKGYVQVVMNGFEGFADLEYTDLIPFKYIEKGISVYIGGYKGGSVSYSGESPFSLVFEQNYYMIEQHNKYTDFTFYSHYAVSNNGKAKVYSYTVDNAKHYLEAGMVAGVKYYSNDGINYYSDKYLTNKVATVYNYYQFLPFRTTTSFSADVLNGFVSSRDGSVLKNNGQAFIDNQDKYGMNAAMVFAMACHESAYGTSGYAVNRYNLFGWSAVDSNPNGASYFNSVSDCVRDMMGRYINWFIDFKDWRYFGYCLGNKGAGLNVKYASDPYWGLGIAAIMYNLDKYANNNNGNLTDYDKYTLGFVTGNYNDVLYGANVAWDANFYKTATGSDVLFTGRYGSHYQKDLIVPIISSEGNRYKINTPNPLSNGELVTVDGLHEYDWNKCVAYINKSDVQILYTKANEDTYDRYEHAAYSNVSEMSLSEDGVLSIGGLAYISNCDFSNSNNISHVVEIVDLSSNEVIAEFECSNTDTSWYNINDGFDYHWAGFSGSYDLSEIGNGNYIFRVRTSYKDKEALTSTLRTYTAGISSFYKTINDNDYRIYADSVYGYRIEFDKSAHLLDLSSYKPSTRSSNVTIDSVTYNGEDADTTMTIEGIAMIYYLNYDSNVSHELYFVNDETVVKANTTTKACSIDYKTLYNSSYNMDNICYSATVKLSDLSGSYKMYMSIKNGDYVDTVQMTNLYNTLYSELDNASFTTTFSRDVAKYGIVFDVLRKG